MGQANQIEGKSFLEMIKSSLLVEERFLVSIIAILSNILFLVFIAIYSGLVYVQFNYFDIFKVAVVFCVFFLGLLAVSQPWVFKSQLKLSWQNLLWSILVFIVLFVLINSPSAQFFDYFRTFPLLEAELGLGWHKDSAFHVSIIHSFNTFGFPSIGQNDTPLLNYHVLSHFVDSILIRLSGIDAWESYGLFYYFKSALLLSSIVFFITSVCKEKQFYVFIISFVFLTPIVIGTWHAVGSHGLWFTSLVTILSSPFVFKLIRKNTPLNTREYFGLFVLLVIISLGKVSSGFAYASLIGFSVFFVNYKSYKLYVFGFSLIVFFVTLNSLMSGVGNDGFSFSGFEYVKNFIFLNTNIAYFQLHQVYLLIFVTGFLAWIFLSNSLGRLFLSSVLTVIVLATVVSFQPNFDSSVVWYFVYGLSSVLLLLVYQGIVYVFSEKNARKIDNYINFNEPNIKFFIVGLILFCASQFNLTSFNIFNINSESVKIIVHNFYYQPFLSINKYGGLDANIAKQVRGQGLSDLTIYPRPLNRFKKDLNKFMAQKALAVKDTLLYIPKEIFINHFSQFRGDSWARGMLAYAVTGVPLIHGIESLRRTYGYADYDESAVWVERKSFDAIEACKFGKSIIVVENFENVDFTLIDCQ